MEISFNVKEIAAYIFIYSIGLVWIGILSLEAIANQAPKWMILLSIVCFISILIAIGLSIKRLLRWYKKNPAVVINSEGITMYTFWTVKHIYWYQVTEIKLHDGSIHRLIPPYVRFSILTNNRRKTLKINVSILNIRDHDLMWTLHQYYRHNH